MKRYFCFKPTSLKIIHTGFLKVNAGFQKYHNDQCSVHLYAHGIYNNSISARVIRGHAAAMTSGGLVSETPQVTLEK